MRLHKRSSCFGGWSIVILRAAMLAGLVGTAGSVSAQDGFVTEDFEDKEVGTFPAGWLDYADVVAPQQENLSTVVRTAGADGAPTNVLEIRSRVGTSQGVYRPVNSEQTDYTVSADLYLAQDMAISPGNVALDIAFAIRSSSDPFSTWLSAGGAGSSTWWEAYSAWPLIETVVGTSIRIGSWHRVTAEVHTSSGFVSSRVVDLASGTEVASVSRTFAGAIGRRFDAVWLSAHHRGSAAGGEAITLIDNITYSDPAGRLFPEASFAIVESPGRCFLPGETVSVDATASTTPEGSEIVSYEWDFGDATLGHGVMTSHAYAQYGRFVISLTITNDLGASSAIKRVVCVAPPPAADPAALLPWLSVDVGSPVFPGSAWNEADGLSVCAGGYRSASDEFHYVYQEAYGDFGIIVALEEPLNWITGARLGLMVRVSLASSAPFAAIMPQKYPLDAKLNFRSRIEDGASVSSRQHNAITFPQWIKLERRGTDIVAYSSPDGDIWTEVERVTIALAENQPVLAGFAACGADSGDPLKGFLALHAHFTGLAIAATETFRRGDSNASGGLDIADAVCTLGYLFGGPGDACAQSVSSCLDAADANDDGTIDIADAVKILAHLFAQAGPLPAPFGTCGVDPTDDGLDCGAYGPCQ